MKTRTKILIPIIPVVVIGLFYLYIVANGYSPYVEGIGLNYYAETEPNKIFEHSSFQSITELTDEELKDVPRIKGMLEMALKQKLPLEEDGFTLFDESLNSYWFNQEGTGLRIMISMSTAETNYYTNWMGENIQSNLVKYKEKYFSLHQWIS